MPTEEQMKAMRESHEAGHTGMINPLGSAIGSIEKAKDRLIIAIAQSGDNEARIKRLRDVFYELEKQSVYLNWISKSFYEGNKRTK